MQWTTTPSESLEKQKTNFCQPKIYFFRDARRCLKRHTLIFIGNDRARQTFISVNAMIKDKLLINDTEITLKEQFKSKDIQVTIPPILETTKNDFSIWTKFLLLDKYFQTDVRNIANKVIRFSSNTTTPNLERKLIFIHPVRDQPIQKQLDYLKQLILYLGPAGGLYANPKNKNAFYGNIVKIFVFALEDPKYPKKVEAFNQNLEKFCKDKINVVFMAVSQLTAKGSIWEDNHTYLPQGQNILVPPNIRVNFNLALNYYCNSQQSIRNMKVNDCNCCL